MPCSASLMRLSITSVKSDNPRAWKKYSGHFPSSNHALGQMRTVNHTLHLKGYPTVLVWGRSAAKVLRYKVSKVIIRGLRFGINCVKSDYFRSKRPENPSGRPCSAVSGWNVIGDGGPSAAEGGLSNGAGISGFHVLRPEIMSGQNSAWRPL
jgi:hypothetical protein